MSLPGQAPSKWSFEMSNSNMNYHEMKQAILQGLVHSGWMAVD